MATYNKRGYKAPKPEGETVDNEFDQYSSVDTSNSTTAEVFNSLDQGANRMEGWVARNQKAIFGIVGAIALVTIGYVGYNKFVVEPKNDEAANEMFQAQSYYNDAFANETEKQNLLNLALNGGEGKLGFLGIIENYKGTASANLAHYYAGTTYLNQGEFKKAIEQLEQYKVVSSEAIIGASALGAIGDAFSELGQHADAFEYYQKAAAHNKNDFTTPRFLYKAGIAALEDGKKADALKLFNEVKNNYSTAMEATLVESLIGLAQ
ncbi:MULTISPECIES: tetratricopeptide repeat protein [unclassified Myroides]|uniref:tetratricopeptide repeat protein n=1 Tax=unclassified Myroides TaxID=2642485 RepID=UPI0015FD4A4B|nr:MULTISPECIES: tetratricopeptide repeat protein [unclassified Myroides]MBB1148971.1 tetratricopeptide repeat protein [Myroides sp. NP-2]MDM1408156.1 tetratricopeptide repeat protein [Myroides sp. DF42-4-2]